jgi:flagellar rod assembly protein/muramidase FlgJ
MPRCAHGIAFEARCAECVAEALEVERMKPLEFVEWLRDGAVRTMREYGIPASFIVAQAALESAWGRSRLAREANNLFGIKAGPRWAGEVIDLPTREFQDGEWVTVTAGWRRYADVAASLADHALFLSRNPRYRQAFLAGSPQMFALRVAQAGYATDPRYAEKIVSIMMRHNLFALDLEGEK